jgi:hypothetical protein
MRTCEISIAVAPSHAAPDGGTRRETVPAYGRPVVGLVITRAFRRDGYALTVAETGISVTYRDTLAGARQALREIAARWPDLPAILAPYTEHGSGYRNRAGAEDPRFTAFRDYCVGRKS